MQGVPGLRGGSDSGGAGVGGSGLWVVWTGQGGAELMGGEGCGQPLSAGGGRGREEGAFLRPSWPYPWPWLPLPSLPAWGWIGLHRASVLGP